MKIIYETADTSMKMPLPSYDTISGQISHNIKGEWDAIEGYNNLLGILRSIDADIEDITKIEEIIAEEKHHTDELEELLLKYDGHLMPTEHGTLEETVGLETSLTEITDDGVILAINGVTYEFTPSDTYSPEELDRKYWSIRRYSDGKALAWLKKNSKSVRRVV